MFKFNIEVGREKRKVTQYHFNTARVNRDSRWLTRVHWIYTWWNWGNYLKHLHKIDFVIHIARRIQFAVIYRVFIVITCPILILYIFIICNVHFTIIVFIYTYRFFLSCTILIHVLYIILYYYVWNKDIIIGALGLPFEIFATPGIAMYIYC